MKINTKAVDYRVDTETQLAGGCGLLAAKQDAEGLLWRSVMANLLWEDLFYEDGVSVTDNIKSLIPQVEAEKVFQIAIEARTLQKLRHVPLLIAREMARIDTHKKLVSKLLPEIILRADELAEFMALYWQDGKQPLSKQVKIGLKQAFNKFDAYQLANNTLPTPDTWEVALSGGEDKKETWTRLINEQKMGALAFVRNLRNMHEVGVSREVILKGFETINPHWLLPLNYLSAAKAVPRYERELETLMLRGLAKAPKLPGYTIFVVDVSGSMDCKISSRSQFSRIDTAAAMAMLAGEMCEDIAVYATAGNDGTRVHSTKFLMPRRGFALSDEILSARNELGRGGIFTRQCLEFIQEKEQVVPDRIIIFSDSQDCDRPNKRVPNPFGKNNYIVDVSAHARGINYEGLWTAEISGWSEHFLSFIASLEGVELT